MKMVGWAEHSKVSPNIPALLYLSSLPSPSVGEGGCEHNATIAHSIKSPSITCFEPTGEILLW